MKTTSEYGKDLVGYLSLHILYCFLNNAYAGKCRFVNSTWSRNIGSIAVDDFHARLCIKPPVRVAGAGMSKSEVLAPLHVVELAIRTLSEYDVFKVYTPLYVDKLLVKNFRENNFLKNFTNRAVVEDVQVGSSDVIIPSILKIQELDPNVVEHLKAELESKKSESADGTDESPEIPAADRFVTFSDNQPEIVELRKRIEAVEEAVKENRENDFPEKEAVLDNLSAALEYLKKSKIVIDSLVGFIKPTLKFIVDKITDAATKATASQALTYIVELFSKIL